MFYESEESIYEKVEEQTASDVYQIFNGLLYHYANCETLWKILESDSFFARNLRFSNDSNEYMTGRETIKKFLEKIDLGTDEKAKLLQDIQNNPMLYFMVCFCENGDLLSQWRGYAKNGVSIGLDFTGGYTEQQDVQKHVERFCVLNNKKYQSENQGNDEKGMLMCKYFLGKQDAGVEFLQMPYKVQYISRKSEIENSVEKKLQKLWEKDDFENGTNNLVAYIPFIKDVGFKEEAEHRLIFDMEFLGQSKAHSDYVRSKKIEFLDSEQIKKPYINVEFGRPCNKFLKVSYISIGGDMLDVVDILNRNQIGNNVEIRSSCERKGIYIGEGNNQEKIMEKIEKCLEAPEISESLKERVKIWCNGHLPIRKIIVGPGIKQQDIKESLEYYKKSIYWLKYIDIEKSKIPLRN